LIILNARILCEQILYFSDYLDREAEVLWPLVVGNDYIRGSSVIDQKVQTELERRYDLLMYIRRLFKDNIENQVKISEENV
jgi:hypothetical protein